MSRYNGPDNQPPVGYVPNVMPDPVYPKPKRKIWPWIVGGLVALVILGCAFGALAIGSAANQAGKALVTVPATGTPHGPNQKAGVKAAPAVSSAPAVSVEQANANAAAASYLDTQSFSRSGLIKQLEFEGYAKKASTMAVDALNVDWNEQAALSAKTYLKGQSFSKKSLTSQLEFEGFTSEQAKYGVSKTGL